MPWRELIKSDEARPATGRRTLYDGPIDVTKLGASGTGAGGATADQAGFTAAFAAAGDFGTVYIPPGNYYVSGGFSLGQGTRVVGGGLENTTINHTGNNTLFLSTFDVWNSSDFNKGSRAFRDFNVIGNAGASARGILEGNSYKTEFKNLRVRAYTNGTGIELSNTAANSWTEGTGFYNVQVRYCARGFALTIANGATGSQPGSSMAETRFVDAVATVNQSGHVALYIGPNVRVYNGIFNLKINVEHAAGVGVQLNTNAVLEDNTYSLYVEHFQAMTAGTLLTTASGTRLRGKGVVWPEPSVNGMDASLNPLTQIDTSTVVDLANPAGQIIRSDAPASDRYYHIATLPVSSSTHDKLVVEVIGGPWWDSTAMVLDRVIMSNAAGFSYQYQRSGIDTTGSRSNFRIIAYAQGGGTTQVWAKAVASQWVITQVRAYGQGISGGSLTPTDMLPQHFPVKPYVTSAPSGSIVFDSGNATTYPPNLAMDVGSINLGGVASSNRKMAKLSSDVTNATTSYADVTGLSFAVTSGQIYRFKAMVIFTVNATTTGTAWSINGPATPTQLAYTVSYPSVTPTYPQPPTTNAFSTYNAMTATTATPATTGNIATIEGIIQPSASGTVAVRFLSKVAVANGVVAKTGSILEWW